MAGYSGHSVFWQKSVTGLVYALSDGAAALPAIFLSILPMSRGEQAKRAKAGDQGPAQGGVEKRIEDRRRSEAGTAASLFSPIGPRIRPRTMAVAFMSNFCGPGSLCRQKSA